MQRLIRLSLLVILLGMFTASVGFSQKQIVYVSGSIKQGDVRIFQKDSLYIIDRDYVVSGTLIIEPGTTIHFHPNGRLIDSTGGRIIADGFAKAVYTERPNNLNPVTAYEPLGYASYEYFFYNAVDQYNDDSTTARTVKIETPKDPTVHLDKYNYIFNVLLDKSTRRIIDLVEPTANPKWRNASTYQNSNQVVVSYEQALIYNAARLYNDPENFDPNMKVLPWKRVGGSNVNKVDIQPEIINFVGQPVTNFTREWGHIIVLPGARAAFFRNVNFENIRKDTTVDRTDLYNVAAIPDAFKNQYKDINARMKALTNGVGGAIATYSSRTWLIDVTFKGNMARNRGGALAILQTPQEYNFLSGGNTAQSLGFYPATKNPNLTNKDGSPSRYNTNTVLRIDNIDEADTISEPFGTKNNEYRQAFDDARTAVFLGRMRRMKFEENYVQLANVKVETIGGEKRVYDIIDEPANYPYGTGNHALGGAIYVAAAIEFKDRLMEIGFGVNNSIMIGDEEVFFDAPDIFVATKNEVRNYQNNNGTEGARGGAIYVGKYTSLIVGGEFSNNSTFAKYFDEPQFFGEKSEGYSRGGAIFAENTTARLQVRGAPWRENINPTYFTSNKAAAGGAIYVDGNAEDTESPVIGGSDAIINTRDYGFDIKFENNTALTFGGAVLSKRNMSINGSGGVEAEAILGYDGKYPVRFWNNQAGFAGGALDVHIPSAIPPLPAFKRAIQIVRAEFVNNTVGADVDGSDLTQIRGGGAIYAYNGDLRLVKATDFIGNTVYHGNGGAVSIISLLDATAKKYFLSDLDNVTKDQFGMPYDYVSNNDIFTGKNQAHPADVRMQTRFLDNKILNPNTEFFNSQLGTGTTQLGTGTPDVVRRNQDSKLPENGIGLGGAIYILDSLSANRSGRIDSLHFNRVKIQNNESYTGSALYSDNYDLKLIFNRSMITGNVATSMVGMEQNVITGPVDKDDQGNIILNVASSDLVGATIYGEIQGPLPSYKFSEAANSIYGNNARFLIRLPDAPNTKGILAGTTGIGFGGTDTLRGNYWGHTEANVNFTVPHIQENPRYGRMETFFVAGDGKSWLPMVYPELINNNPADPRKKGPFESMERGDITYIPVILKNAAGDQNTPDAASIPEKLVFSGHIYDVYDKGTDIKTADYSKRRMSPIEDFAVGIPPRIRTFEDANQPSYNKVIKRWTRDPYIAELRDGQGNLVYPGINAVQTEFKADEFGVYYHPIGYPLYLESKVNYEDLTRRSNHDPRIQNESVYFVINLKTGDYIRANLKQVSEDAPYRETFRQTIELVPDSTNRTDPTWRRSAEGLANLGSGPELLANLVLNAYNEDFGTLPGRRYSADDNLLARVPNLFSNRDQNGNYAMPASNLIGGTSWTTYYAGERYRALPVRVGDSVLIVSRTILWREGVHAAATKGMAFRITESTRPPVWTGNIITLQTDTVKKRMPSEDNPNVKVDVVYTEFLNKIFLTEDRPYPVSFKTYSGLDLYGDPQGDLAGGRGRDSVLRITAIDSNRFYDPRSFIDANGYARLTYDWETHPNSAIRRWIVVRQKVANDGQAWGAQGYLELAGLPINPFIVPGGDSITFFVHNYPPHYRNYDNLKAMTPPVSQDEINQWIETYPSYLSNQTYDESNARFLQQDTINVGPNYTSNYTMKVFVVDSMPRFLEPGQNETIYRVDDPSTVYVDYVGSDYKCGLDRNNRLVANLTDKLRFQVDINTDDELEDKSPAAAGWDFRYGKTAYGFLNVAIRQNPNDTSAVDTIHYDGDELIKWPEGDYVVQSRPEWMANEFLTKFNTDDVADPFGTDFTTHGQLNIRIPKDKAFDLLMPDRNYNFAYNTDTVFTIVVNDGHGGINSRMFNLFINIQPEITTESLPFAIEDRDYNPSMLDEERMIKVYDPNLGQKHTFRLIYSDTPENEIPVDACYDEAGKIDLTGIKTTPKWLEINPNTGLLYGTPRVKDAPKNETITVIVTDENGLSSMKRIPLEVRGVSHNPEITGLPVVECIDPAKPYTTTITIVDTDLDRTNPRETITLKLLDYLNLPLSGMSINPTTYSGNGTSDNFTATITKTGSLQADPDGWITIKVVVEDAFKNVDTLVFRLTISDATDFTANVRITNVKGSYQDMVFGTSSVSGTSTGDGNDNNIVGKLDENLCEYELPPVPFDDVFDARWTIPNRNGVLRNIFPQGQNLEKSFIYFGRFQAGGVLGGSSPLYPVTISWNSKDIPAVDDNVKNPAGSSWFLKDRFSDGNIFVFNMRSPNQYAVYNSQVSFLYNDATGEALLTINDDGIDQFVIMHDWTSSVTDLGTEATSTKINLVSPNPVTANSNIEFEVLQSGKTKLQVVDLLGNVLITLADEELQSGKYNVQWNGNDATGNKLANGQYMLRLVSGSAISTYPVVIVK